MMYYVHDEILYDVYVHGIRTSITEDHCTGVTAIVRRHLLLLLLLTTKETTMAIKGADEKPNVFAVMMRESTGIMKET